MSLMLYCGACFSVRKVGQFATGMAWPSGSTSVTHNGRVSCSMPTTFTLAVAEQGLVGAGVGLDVGDRVGAGVGCCVGGDVGANVGAFVGADVGDSVGLVGALVGAVVGLAVGASVGEFVVSATITFTE